MTIHPAPASETAENAHSLSFPATHYAKLFPREFLAAHLPASRPSGRAPSAARRPTVHTGSLTHAHGSAVVRLGDTAAVCGVRGEILYARDVAFSPRARAWLDRAARSDGGGGDDDVEADDDDADVLAELGLLVPNIELATGCNPQHLPGSPPSVLAQSLSQRVLTLLRITRLLSLAQLIIWSEPPSDKDEMDRDAMEMQPADDFAKPGDGARSKRTPMAFWTLYIDVLLISLDGSAGSAAWASILSALLTTSLPAARWDFDRSFVICTADMSRKRRLIVNGLPLIFNFAVFEPPLDHARSRQTESTVHVLMDPDDFEESCCSEEVTVVIDQAGKLLWRVEKSGGTALEASMVRSLVKSAGQQWLIWHKTLGDAQVLQAQHT